MQDYPRVLQPEAYSRKLFNHQLTSIYEMEVFENTGKIDIDGLYSITSTVGIQADPTGFGKTASMVGLIVRDRMTWSDSDYQKKEIYSCSNNFSILRHTNHKKLHTTLIVAGQSLVSQWKDEFSLTNLSLEIVRTRKKARNTNPEEFDVIICTPTMYNILVTRFQNIAWKRLIYDEPGTTQIPRMASIICGFIWFVTATPGLLRAKYATGRRSHFISHMGLGYLEMLFFNSLQIKNSLEYVKSSWVMPPVHTHYYDCFQPISQTIRGLAPRRAELMIEAGNIRGAIRFMGGQETDSIIDLVRGRFEEELEDATFRISRYTRRRSSQLLEEWKLKKERIESKIIDLNTRFENALSGQCHICMENLVAPSLVPCCQNIFCGKCIIEWLKRSESCPLCREELYPPQLTLINRKIETTEGKCQKSARINTKAEQIVDIIKSKQEGKYIIFSEEDATFNVIKMTLAKNDICCKEIKGRSECREKVINNFKYGEQYVIFLNSRNNGAGINLQECTDIILYHGMNTDIQTQILGRANRIGRTMDLHVHHLRIHGNC